MIFILSIIVVILVLAVAALVVAVASVSAVAVLAQMAALLSQCVVAAVLLALGGTVVGSLVLRQRVIQLFLARRLLGDETDRLLAQPPISQAATLPEMFPQQWIDRPPSAIAASLSRRTPSLIMPAVPHGWGFDEED